MMFPDGNKIETAAIFLPGLLSELCIQIQYSIIALLQILHEEEQFFSW